MRGFRFDLKALLSLMSAACIITWAVSAPSVPSVVVTVLLVAGIFAWLGTSRGLLPSMSGSVAGAATSVLLIAVFLIAYIAGYFYEGKPADYFEDGMKTKLIIFPLVYTFVYAPIGSLLGFFIGFVVGQVMALTGHDLPSEPLFFREVLLGMKTTRTDIKLARLLLVILMVAVGLLVWSALLSIS
jgi:hypothetical protein